MINIDKKYREAIISKYQTKEAIYDKAHEVSGWLSENISDITEVVTLTGDILDSELEEIKESIFKNDKSAYYLTFEAVKVLLESSNYGIEAINVYEVKKDEMESLISKQIMLEEREWVLAYKDVYKITSNDNYINIITTNLVLESNNFSDYTNLLDCFNGGVQINIVGHPEIDIKQLIEENDKNTLFKALKNQIIKVLNIQM